MTPPSSSPRALRWILVVSGILGAVLVFLLRPAPAPAPVPAAVAPAQVAKAPPPVVKPAPAPAAPLPAGEVYVEGQGLATVVPSEEAQSIPHADGPTDDPSVNPPIEPEKPQTPEWKLEKTERIAGHMSNRISRIEARLKELQARGDKAALEEERVLLERTKKRRGELDQEMAALREQIRSNGGTVPAVAGQSTP
ncbi:MAG TPA: hypothetical protein VK447_11480 [Myxococcaceae bacterium]|nr:hypothetical protein [Myxococcaceae bacterium]